MRSLALFAIVFLSIGCAERQQLPPGTDLEIPEDPPTVDAGRSDMPKASDKELATAWEPPKPPVALVDAPPDEATVERTLSAQGEAETRAKFKDLLVGGRRALAMRNVEDAQTISVGSLELAAELSPAEFVQAVELSFKVAFAQEDVSATVKAAERWLKSCGPEKVDSCRRKALAALKSVGKIKGASMATLTEKLTAVRDADACVQEAEATRSSPPCLDSAASVYRRQKDKLMVARVSWARLVAALADSARAGEVDGLVKKVEADCTEVRCTTFRRKALKIIANRALATGDAEAAARAILKEMRLGAAVLPADKRPYARSPEVDKICLAFDAKAGLGACRKLEKKLNGNWLFRDFSQSGAKATLEADKVKSVNEHFSCLLQECLTMEADRLTPPGSVTYEVQWTVTNDGRVGNVRLGRKDQELGPMLPCLRKQFVHWRYPKYFGELQHVVQRFTVGAHERRTR